MEKVIADKDWEALGISNDFIFGKVMQDLKLCKRLLEIILNVKIKWIDYPVRQKSVEIYDDAKGIRLDVYVDDDKGTVYNIEMQAANNDDFPKRSRYYGSLIDLDMLERGETYRKLKHSYVIFICTFDLFGQSRHIYSFENRCIQDTSLALNDGAYRIFLNAKGTADDVSPECKAFLEYVAGKPSDDEFVLALEKRVREVKMNKEWRRDYMTLHMRDLVNREDGRKEGREEGRAEGLAIAILRVLKKNGSIKQTADLFDLSTQEIVDVAQKYGTTL